MAFQGNFSDFRIIELFQMLAQQEKTGDLEIKNLATITFQRGRIVELFFLNNNDKLERYLIQHKLLKEENLKFFQQKAKREVKKITSVLEESGVLPSILKEKILYLYYHQKIFNLLMIESGVFAFKNRTISDEEVKKYNMYPIDVEQVLLEAIRQKDELTIIKKEIPIKNATIIKNKNLPRELLHSLTDIEKEVYISLNQENDLEEVLDSLFIFNFEALQAIMQLNQKGAITISQNFYGSKIIDDKHIRKKSFFSYVITPIFALYSLFFITIVIQKTSKTEINPPKLSYYKYYQLKQENLYKNYLDIFKR
ncbi:DUF4388 domain-containing protein [bacterium]|nr:DUF4388 domain-containing protein [bacterium]